MMICNHDIRAAILALDPCSGAREWIEALPPEQTPEESYTLCDRGDWLLWLAVEAGVDRRIVVLAACDVARIALVHGPEGEERPLRAIETAERWARGEASLEEVRRAADAAADYAADRAADAAAARAADAAAYAADAAAYAADAADYAALAEGARLVRARIPWAMIAAAPAVDMLKPF